MPAHRPPRREVLGEQRGELGAQRRQPGDVGRVEEALARGRHVEQQLRVPPHRREPDAGQLSDALHALVLRRVMKPAWADRHVGLRGPPRPAAGGGSAVLERGDDRVTRRPRIGDGRRVDGGPIRVARRSGLVAAPAHVGTGVGEHHRVGLEPAHEAEDAGPIVHLPAPIGPLTVGPVEPHFGDGAVAREQLRQLVAVEVVVARRVAVHRRVAVPRREIQPGAETLAPAGVGELAHDIARAAPPRAPRARVLGDAAGPQTEAVVMLGGEDQGPGPARARGPGPLGAWR